MQQGHSLRGGFEKNGDIQIASGLLFPRFLRSEKQPKINVGIFLQLIGHETYGLGFNRYFCLHNPDEE